MEGACINRVSLCLKMWSIIEYKVSIIDVYLS